MSSIRLELHKSLGGERLEDNQIVSLYFLRDEKALFETEKKYKKYLHYIANTILASKEDSEECVIDTYLRAWNSIPPNKPSKLSVFLGKITKNLCLDKISHDRAKKRGGSSIDLAYEELEGTLSDTCENCPLDTLALKEAINSFLASLPETKRRLFVQRYWYLSSIADIAKNNDMTEANVKVVLLRLRESLKEHLEKEGFNYEKR